MSGYSQRQVITGLAKQSTINRSIPARSEDTGLHHRLCHSIKATPLLTTQSVRHHSSHGRRQTACPTVVSLDRTNTDFIKDQTRRSRQALPQPTKLRWSAGSNRSRARVREEDEATMATPLNVEFAPTKDEIKEDFNSISDSSRIIRPHQFIQDQQYWPGIVKISENGERTGRSNRKASRNTMSPWIRTYKVKQDRNVVRKLLHSRPGSEASESPQFMLE